MVGGRLAGVDVNTAAITKLRFHLAQIVLLAEMRCAMRVAGRSAATSRIETIDANDHSANGSW